VDVKYFAEGLTIFGKRVFQLTDKSRVALVYDLKYLGPTRTFLKYKGWDRGWGLTHDDKYLILSDSTEHIHFVDPWTIELVRSISVKDGDTLIRGLNELEYIDGLIYGNLYPFDLILRIDPRTGIVLGKIDISTLGPDRTILCPNCVPNGIAHNKESGNLYVTGKLWPMLYEIRLR
jgi:glutamine cyclotransferase